MLKYCESNGIFDSHKPAMMPDSLPSEAAVAVVHKLELDWREGGVMPLSHFTAKMEVFSIKKPNSICKNINCKRAFYACAFCTHHLKWRSLACCPECFDEYTKQVIAARAANRKVNLLPERTDMSEEQVKELIAKPTDEVIKTTKEELSEYADDLDAIGLGATIDKINEEIREAQTLEEESIPLSQETGKSNRNKKK